MSAQELALAVSVFLASAVEMVEALTIVLAIGLTRGWQEALRGALAAALVLCVAVAALGPALAQLPLRVLQVGFGLALLAFGLRWLRKAVLRAAGLRAKHDEQSEFAEVTAAAREAGAVTGGFDRYAFSVAFQGVLIEGLEVVFIVLTFGSPQHHVPLAAAAAGTALVVVALGGVLVRAPLAKVPENQMKYGVGVLLSSFGLFWLVEGIGVHWPGGELSLTVLLPAVLITSLLAVQICRRRAPA